jgi:hypothetical protein
MTGRTRCRGRAWSGPCARAALAGIEPRNLDLGLETEGCVHEAELEIVAKIGATLSRGTTPSSPPQDVTETEQVSKDISKLRKDAGIESGYPGATVDVAKAVVVSSLLSVAQNTIGFRGFFKPFFRFLVPGILVWVILYRQFAVGSFDLLF